MDVGTREGWNRKDMERGIREKEKAVKITEKLKKENEEGGMKKEA